MITESKWFEVKCDTCKSLCGAGSSKQQAIDNARLNGDAVDDDYDPPKVMCAFCKREWMDS